MRREGPLAAFVPKAEADRAIAELQAEGCYDHDRRIREAGPETLAIPITDGPTETAVGAVREQRDPDWRVRNLDDLLRDRGFSATERERAPGSWAVVGSVILARFDGTGRERAIGEALLELHGGAHTVLATEGIEGPHREPQVRVVAGADETETVHVEHGTEYAMDLAEVMFSPGNQAERVRMGQVVEPGDQVFDMFAGIGYFTLPMARAGAEVVATERNPAAFAYLRENLERNEVADQVDAYRLDCRALRPRADRVVMGHYDATEYLDAGLAALRPGGIVHLHAVAPADDRWASAEGALADAAGAASVTVRDRRVVKTHSPGLVHVVVDARVGAVGRSRG